MTRTDVLVLMASSTSIAEWRANFKKVTADFGGRVPNFWLADVIESGLYHMTFRKMKGLTESLPAGVTIH